MKILSMADNEIVISQKDYEQTVYDLTQLRHENQQLHAQVARLNRDVAKPAQIDTSEEIML